MRRLFRIMNYYNSKKFEREPSSFHLFLREIARQGMESYETGRKVVWTTAYAFPMEMLRPLGLIPIDFELHSSLFSSFGFAEEALRSADRIGVPVDMCTVHRVAIGAAYSNRLPRPDILISTTHYCDGKPKTNEYMRDLFNVDYILIDVPQRKDLYAQKYLEEQLRNVFRRLCELAELPYDEKMLIEPIRHFNEMTRFLLEIEGIRKRRPSPFLPGNRGFILTFFATLLYGKPELNDVYRLLIDELKRYQDRCEEKYRFMWLMASPTYDQNIFETLETFGARIVAEELGLVYWNELDESNPVGSMARRILDNPFLGPIQGRIDFMKRKIIEYGIDGIIHFCHMPCRQGNGALWLLKEAAEEMGVRFINIEADILDPANFSPERVKTQIMANMEILKDRRRQ
jgi:benzoyl-CoA reductase/2-hydroxyglutaryl-CoA dehydratase subunit BcrC/BadD/HgdB